MAAGETSELDPETIVHRIGGGHAENLGLRPMERRLNPVGISLLLGGTPAQSARQMREAFPDPVKFGRLHSLALGYGRINAYKAVQESQRRLAQTVAKLTA